MIEVILSPDLALEERREARRAACRVAAAGFKLGDTVKAGENGFPGKLEAVNENGMASIRWPDGRLLTGVEATDLRPA